MTTRGLILLFLSAFLTAASNLLIRGGLLRAGGLDLTGGRLLDQILAACRQPMFVFGFVVYGAAAVIWFAVISMEDLSTSYPLLVSFVFTMVTVGAVIFFQEKVSPQKMVGLAVILTGVFLVARA